MILRSLLIWSVGIGAPSLMTGTFATAIAQKDVATSELGSCAAYSGLPSDGSDTAGMVFIRGGTFVMGSSPALRGRTTLVPNLHSARFPAGRKLSPCLG